MRSQQFVQQDAYILHKRHYRDTSLLIDLFTREHGRLTVVARAGRTAKHKSLLQLFRPLNIDCAGRGDLFNLRRVDSAGAVAALAGDAVLLALYVNELLMRVLPLLDAHPQLYIQYQQLLTQLSLNTQVEANLRCFELDILQALGYAVQLDRETKSGEILDPAASYYFSAAHGVARFAFNQAHSEHRFSGRSLLALHTKQWDDTITLRDAKRFMRIALAPLLGSKPLKSRELFSFKQGETE